MKKVYSQNNVSLAINGHNLRGLAEGTSVTFTLAGGEVQKTQGTDGPAINIATDQGAQLQFTLTETSTSYGYLLDLIKTQRSSLNGVTVVFRTGSDVLYTLSDCFLGHPGQISTGDKTQGSYQFTVESLSVAVSNT